MVPTIDSPLMQEFANRGFVNPEELQALVRAKKQELEAKDAVNNGVPWWQAKGGQTSWYSGNKPETSNDQFLKENGGPVGEGDYARSRGQASTEGRGGIGADEFAQWQESQKPVSRDMGTINNLSGMSPESRAAYETQQMQLRSANRTNAANAEKKSAADYAATPEGTINNAKMIMRRLGISPQQALANATAQGNPGLDPAGMQAAAVMPNFAMGNANNNARLGMANVNADVAKAGQANRLEERKMINEGNIAGINAQGQNAMGIQDQRNKTSILQAMIAQGLVPNDMGGGQGAPPSNPMGVKIPPAIGPQQGSGPWWNQGGSEGGVPGFTRLPPSLRDQIMLDQAKQQSELGGLQIQNERNKLNPAFPIDQQAAQRAAELKARLNDPAFVFSESNADPIRFAVKNWHERGEPLPVSVESGLRNLHKKDLYDSDNKHLGNAFGLIGAGGYGQENDAQVYADYLETHFGIPADVGVKLYKEKVIKSGVQSAPIASGDVIGNGML
jgi:hypothetical protein